MRTFDTALGRFETYDEGTIPRDLAIGRWWNAHVGHALQQATPGGWALDLGAHLGWFTVDLAARHDHVLAVEPHPQTYGYLDRNLRIHHPELLPKVQWWPLAAYSHATTLQFAVDNDPTDAGAWGFTPLGIRGRTSLQVPAIALDVYLDPAQAIHVIKCDCQGADLHALRGLRQTLGRWHPLIVFEFEEGMAQPHQDTWADYQAFFDQYQYTLSRISAGYWDYLATPRTDV